MNIALFVVLKFMKIDNSSAHERLRDIFEYQMRVEELDDNIITMMKCITANQERFDAFHKICAFLFLNYFNDFIEEMGIEPLRIEDVSSYINLPKNKIN